MILQIDIPDKLYKELCSFCEFNNITLEDYVYNTVYDNYFTLKYGDLNEKIKPKVEEKKKNSTRKASTKKVEDNTVNKKETEIDNIQTKTITTKRKIQVK